MRDYFSTPNISSKTILEKLIPKPKSKFELPEITLSETKKLINKLDSSNAVGHDNSSIKIYKKLNEKISPHITHLINTIIRTGVYPKI